MNMPKKMQPVVDEITEIIAMGGDCSVGQVITSAVNRWTLDQQEAHWLRIEMIKRIPEYRG